MTRLRRFAIAALAAATVTLGSLAIVPAVVAMPRNCIERHELAQIYTNHGYAFYSIGAYVSAYYWWGKAEAIMVGCY